VSNYTYDMILHNINALIQKQLISRYIQITLLTDIKHVTCC